MVFNFIFPPRVQAGFLKEVEKAPAKLLSWIITGIYEAVNNFFVSEEREVSDDNEENIIYLTPENIIKGKFIIFNANIFENIEETNETFYDIGEGNWLTDNVIEGRMALRETLAGWYYALRNFAIVSLLAVLVYVGIRMILSTVSQDKAKYLTIILIVEEIIVEKIIEGI